jgi:hypothetical protein
MSCGARFDESEAHGLKCNDCHKLAERSKQRSVERARHRADAVDVGHANLRSLLMKGKRR